jgi:hypothetical protein
MAKQRTNRKQDRMKNLKLPEKASPKASILAPDRRGHNKLTPQPLFDTVA